MKSVRILTKKLTFLAELLGPYTMVWIALTVTQITELFIGRMGKFFQGSPGMRMVQKQTD